MTGKKPIVVVGSINMDLVAKAARMPLAGETLVGTGFSTTPGGKGANQAVAASRLGYPVHMLGMVGEDVFGEILLDKLVSAGVHTGAILRASGPSGVSSILISSTGENRIVIVPGANSMVTAEYIDSQSSLLGSAGMVLCQLETPLETVSHVLSICSQAGIPVMLDPAPAAQLPDDIWSQITWFTPNETEAAFYLSDFTSPEVAMQQLLARGLHGILLKRGAEGAWLATSDTSTQIMPFPVIAVDTVGAGDCFNGAFAVAVLEGYDPQSAARFASAAASLSVTGSGAQPSMPTRIEVDALIAQQT